MALFSLSLFYFILFISFPFSLFSLFVAPLFLVPSELAASSLFIMEACPYASTFVLLCSTCIMHIRHIHTHLLHICTHLMHIIHAHVTCIPLHGTNAASNYLFLFMRDTHTHEEHTRAATCTFFALYNGVATCHVHGTLHTHACAMCLPCTRMHAPLSLLRFYNVSYCRVMFYT